MRPGSLKLRLLAASSLSILTTLVLIGLLLLWIFEQHVRSRMAADLGHHLNQLAALVSLASDGTLKIDGELTDPRFDQPLGGLYWQVDHEGRAVKRSRSLWDASLRLPEARSGVLSVSEIAGPEKTPLMAAVRVVVLNSWSAEANPKSYSLAVAADLKELEAGRSGMLKSLVAGLSLAFAGLVFAAWAQVYFGLKPLEAVRSELTSVRGGHKRDLEPGSFPEEVRPLADEINAFLSLQRNSVDRARRRAGDLAHGLKTPLSALAAEADGLARAGHGVHSAALVKNIGIMRRHIERQLALARSQGGRNLAGARVPHIGEAIEATIDLLKKLPRDQPLVWQMSGDLDASAGIEREDFDEVIGNLLDNARKWARSTVAITATDDVEGVSVIVCDDGPGIDEADLRAALERGKRLDERVQGSGLGLSIVQAILESYASELHLKKASSGGLEASFIIAKKSDHPFV